MTGLRSSATGTSSRSRSIETLRRRTLRSLSIEFAEPVDPASFAGLANVRDVSVDGRVLTCKVTGSVDGVIKAAARNTVLNITAENSSLEEIFMNFYEGDSPQADDDAELRFPQDVAGPTLADVLVWLWPWLAIGLYTIMFYPPYRRKPPACWNSSKTCPRN